MTTAQATVVGTVDDLTPGEGRTYVVDGRQIAVFLLTDGTVRAMDAVCPHRGGPLADGQIDGAVVVCPLHQYQFSLDTGRCTTEGIGTVATYSADVVDGQVAVRLS
ncbi:2Fe-2S ferredoxin [Rhodococcus sp. Leaf7]|uniref:Rieske (2Fe-2S) protein n=1 Tax=unclassified Rhodococcus (in: high G+C Gram-positive bacteria) TaxID=192944 RepID=UPI0005AC6774|nr:MULTISPECIES: Rieske 2Fe-2S domain-containing protein [unclassified Rhodococcus (in: high G+C Gram-positive bacteria)]KIQ20814.1 2Fe-2S ferredoxin [Rhodococcus sp. MEB064]KQU03046.1 2Fe-2S ferredoxin [Rhodococcus sp. Leaf7]KQU38846.1 2Fe-2S ferredoxin [Rhodococcus sp. Leaf247]